jgi:outer membrane protein assembly factor BamD
VVKIVRTIGLVLILAAVGLPAHGQLLHKKKAPSPVTEGDSVAPDKVLYERAMDGIKHGRYEVARLQLNTLLNAYPDSAYLAKGKLAIADSYFKEGGTGNLNLAIDEYKSFITFFPNLDEAAYAQMQVAMTHYRRMDKADRDRTEAQYAEQEFQIFLQKYPDSPLAAQSQQHLREVQETLADGDFRIATYYYGKKDSRAAASRLTDIIDRYPLYSRADQSVWMLANIWQKAPIQTKSDEQLAAVRKQLAINLYSRIVQDYPLSPFANGAKQRIKDLGATPPQPDPAALARMQQEQNMPRPRNMPVVGHVSGMIHSGPDVSRAARVGMPNMSPPDENGGETLKVAMNGMNISANGRTAPGAPAGAEGSTTSGSGTAETSTGSTGQQAGQQLVSTEGTSAANPVSGSTPPPAAGAQPANAVPSSSSSSSSTQPAANSSAPTTPQGAGAKPCPPADSKATGSTDGKAAPAAGSAAGTQTGCTQTDGKESSSKKKKGIKKIIPWSGSGPNSN